LGDTDTVCTYVVSYAIVRLCADDGDGDRPTRRRTSIQPPMKSLSTFYTAYTPVEEDA